MKPSPGLAQLSSHCARVLSSPNPALSAHYSFQGSGRRCGGGGRDGDARNSNYKVLLPGKLRGGPRRGRGGGAGLGPLATKRGQKVARLSRQMGKLKAILTWGDSYLLPTPRFSSYWRGPCQITLPGSYGPVFLPGSQKIKPHSWWVPRKMELVRFGGTAY